MAIFDNFYNFGNFWQFWQIFRSWQFLTVLAILAIFENFDDFCDFTIFDNLENFWHIFLLSESLQLFSGSRNCTGVRCRSFSSAAHSSSPTPASSLKASGLSTLAAFHPSFAVSFQPASPFSASQFCPTIWQLVWAIFTSSSNLFAFDWRLFRKLNCKIYGFWPFLASISSQ